MQPLTAEQIALVHKRIAEALKPDDHEMLAEPNIEGKLRLARRRHPKSGGLVYFIRCGDFIKIGWTHHDDVMPRARQISPCNPYPLFIVQTTPGPPALEKEFHRAFRHLRHRAEWFHYSEEFEAALIGLD